MYSFTMNVSHLLSSITRGKWLIDPNAAFANNTIIDGLLNRDYSEEKYLTTLSQNNPLQVLLQGKQTDANLSQYDNIPKGSTAVFNLSGSMLKYGTWCSYGTTELANAMKDAAMHPNIESFVLNIDSGGGSVDSIAPMLEVVKYAQSQNKAVVALVDLCASAAYYVASHCDEIIAGNDISSEIGSIGVMMSFMDYAKHYEDQGIKQHVIFSSLSEYKNQPFIKALEGKYEQIIAEELDPLARKFQEDVTRQRGNKLKKETVGLLSGKMFFAPKAHEVGLIDGFGDMNYALSRAKLLSEKRLINNYLQ